MALVTTNWSPNSFQLRFSFQCRRSPAILVRVHAHKLDLRVRVFSVAGNGNGVGRRNDGNSWISSESKGDYLAGWSGSDGSEQSCDSQKKRWSGGIVGAGVAGVILVAGLTFANFSLSKRNVSRPEQQMEPLTIQQEVSLTSGYKNGRVEEGGIKGKDATRDEGNLPEEYSLESEIGIDTIDSRSIQEQILDESAFDDTLVAYKAISSPSVVNFFFKPCSFKDSDVSLGSPESSQVAGITNLNSDHQEAVPGLERTENSNFLLESSSRPFHKEHKALKLPFCSSSYMTVEPRTFHKDNFAAICSFAETKHHNVDNMLKDLNGSGIHHTISDRENLDQEKPLINSSDGNISSLELQNLGEAGNQSHVSDRDDLLDEDKLQRDSPDGTSSSLELQNLSEVEIQLSVSDRENGPDGNNSSLELGNPSEGGSQLPVSDREDLLDLDKLKRDSPDGKISSMELQNPSEYQISLPVSDREDLLELDELCRDSPDGNISSVELQNQSEGPIRLPVSDTEHLLDLYKLWRESPDGNISSLQLQNLLLLDKRASSDGNISSLELQSLHASGSSKATSTSALPYPFEKEQIVNVQNNVPRNDRRFNESSTLESSSFSAGIPAPSAVCGTTKVLPGQVLVPAVLDQVHAQALAALQVLKVIESDVQPSDLCTRREYARWLVSASSALSRNTASKVYPAMYIENVTELAFDDITPDDPDFPSIQGLAEAGLISSKLSRDDLLSSFDAKDSSFDEKDQSPFYFSPESPLSRQELVSWKMALEKKRLPDVDREILCRVSGFIDAGNIHPDACPALMADVSAGEQGITALAFGYTRLFQPNKPVTKAQAAVALATGEGSDIVGEELARIEAESMAEKAVAEHSAIVAQVEKDLNATFEKELSKEREKIDAVEKLAEEARQELENLRAKRDEDSISLMKERAAVESEMEVLSRLRREVEEQLQDVMSNKLEISYEKERIKKLRKKAESENQEIARLQYELEVERKALSMARAWAEDEAKRAREQAKALVEARDRWEKHGIKVIVDKELREETATELTWLETAKQFSVDGTVDRAENLVDKLKAMGSDLSGKSRDVIDTIVMKLQDLISILREWTSEVGRRVGEVNNAAVVKVGGSLQELQRNTTELSFAVKEGAKRMAEDCRGGVEKLTQKFRP